MAGILQVFCGLVVASAVLALASYASRRSHAGREPRAAGRAAVSPVRHQAAGGMAVPAVTVQARTEITGPYGYDNGLAIAREET